MNALLAMAAYMLLAPLAGGLLAGVDRRITARMQQRVGPPLAQPFYDVLKLFEKEHLVVNRVEHVYLLGYLVFMIASGALFFAGGDLLLVVFALALASIFLVVAAYSANSPYSHIGAERELLQLMACEPMLLMAVMGLYLGAKSFAVAAIASFEYPLIIYLPGVFLGLVYILTIKLRKSPFDLSTSHHAHQELVKGLTTEFSGPALAVVEIAHWYENILLLGLIYLFFAPNPALAVVATLLVYFFEIFIDNTHARLKWQWTVTSSWVVSAVAGGGNIIVLYYLMKAGT